MRTLVQRLARRAGTLARLAASEAIRPLGLTMPEPVTARQALDSWLLRLGSLPPIRGRILISAVRNYTWIEWAVYCACVLRRVGFAPVLLFHSTEIKRLYPEPRVWNFWARVPAIPDLRMFDLDHDDATASDHTDLATMAQAAAAWVVAYDHHVEEADVREDFGGRYAGELARTEEQLQRVAARFDRLLRDEKFDRFLCYSGLIGDSPALLHTARAHGLTTVCLEGWAWRPGHMIYNLNAPALEYNVAGWLRHLGAWDATKEREVDAYLKFLDGENWRDEDWLNNFYRIQRDRLSTSLPEPVGSQLADERPLFVLAPNVIGDSSMLRRETIFPSQQFWIREVIRWFAARPHLKLMIRAHPAEVWVGSKCVIHMGKVAREAAAGATNVLILDSTSTINTFSLIPFARAGLVWLSSAGVDFVIRGLPAAVAARPKYGGIGVTSEPATREDYFDLLAHWAESPERPTPDQITQGKRYLHMVFKGFSFEAGARNYRATQLYLDRMPNQAEHDRFFRIIAGDEPMPDQP